MPGVGIEERGRRGARRMARAQTRRFGGKCLPPDPAETLKLRRVQAEGERMPFARSSPSLSRRGPFSVGLQATAPRAVGPISPGRKRHLISAPYADKGKREGGPAKDRAPRDRRRALGWPVVGTASGASARPKEVTEHSSGSKGVPPRGPATPTLAGRGLRGRRPFLAVANPDNSLPEAQGPIGLANARPPDLAKPSSRRAPRGQGPGRRTSHARDRWPVRTSGKIEVDPVGQSRNVGSLRPRFAEQVRSGQAARQTALPPEIVQQPALAASGW